MTITELREDDYCIHYDSSLTTVFFEGKLSLRDPSEYRPITEFLENVVNSKSEDLTLDFQKLEFLNSSGIRVLSKFVSNLRKNKIEVQLTVLGSKEITWQSKSLRNLQKFMPNLVLNFQ
ncbi:STAS domain-containing protein [Roseofilum sp. BLCC_M91]|uniref:STAS domain-containing protein n=1 Tax=Roseofilum halophilum BLCC-M91 TaxID=3022259 RepID=A0ABT7BFW6_9CYAN|nr:STAS domain-containing protein [Roseofilum halophilum]MDJ1178065.1 STAS domain-containing protein [Roseofilum halophilum BLCC-M91]